MKKFERCLSEKMKVKGENGTRKELEKNFAHINICIILIN